CCRTCSARSWRDQAPALKDNAKRTRHEGPPTREESVVEGKHKPSETVAMLRCLHFGTFFRLLGWSLFAAFLAFVGWSLYVLLPPKPRWMIEARLGPQGFSYPACFLSGGSGVVFLDFTDRDTNAPVRISVRDMRTGAELPGACDAIKVDVRLRSPNDATFFR